MTLAAPDPLTTPRPVRPALAFRVGVTGTRKLPTEPVARERIAREVQSVLAQVKAQAEELAADQHLLTVYAADPDGVVRPSLRIVSPLAEGADRLVAQIALELGYRLDVPMPFTQQDYETDFNDPQRDATENAASLAEFRALTARAGECALPGQRRVLQLDGARGDDEAASYGAVGRLVVRNCDLLIAIWDGHPGKGSGGTADMVRFASRSGPPVWWIDAKVPREPAWVETFADLRRPTTMKRGTDAEAMLRLYLESILLPPEPASPLREGVLSRIFQRAQPPLPRFLDEHMPKDKGWTGWLWRSEQLVMKAALKAGIVIEAWLEAAELRLEASWHRVRHPLAPPLAKTVPEPCLTTLPESAPDTTTHPLPGDAAASYWRTIFVAPDDLAVKYANRYRSSYALVTVCAALALFAGGGTSLWLGGALVFAVVEAAALGLLFLFVALNQRRSWHERWISYRLLAELCRNQSALARLGWSLPLGETWRVARGEQGIAEGRIGAVASRDAWVGWYFHAAMRAAPLAAGKLTGADVNGTRRQIEKTLLDEQIGYHLKRAWEARFQGRGLAGWGEVLLLLMALLVLAKLIALLAFREKAETVASMLEIATQYLVVFSAAFIALRVYAELELLADSNAAMASMMRAAKRRLSTLHAAETDQEKATCPALVSQELGAAVHQTALEMLAETDGWARLFKVKSVEAA